MTQTAAHSLDRKEPAPTSRLYELTLQHFRCFAHQKFEFCAPTTVVVGHNGAGKTSLLEAIYYTSYGTSFKTRTSKQMIQDGQEAFNIKLDLKHDEQVSQVIVGYGGRKKLLKINNQPTKLHKDVSDLFSCVTLTQEDIELVNRGPDRRRAFLNQNQYLSGPDWASQTKRYRQILDNRNALLSSQDMDQGNLKTWTSLLWEQTRLIQAWRIDFIQKLELEAGHLIREYMPGAGIEAKMEYKPAVSCQDGDFESFFDQSGDLLAKERVMGRTMLGAHLDDFSTHLHGRCARNFASRGEQKLLSLLIKCAALKVLQRSGTNVSCILIDDFLTDLDKDRMLKCQEIISQFGLQTIITMPIMRKDFFTNSGAVEQILLGR